MCSALFHCLQKSRIVRAVRNLSCIDYTESIAVIIDQHEGVFPYLMGMLHQSDYEVLWF